MTRLTLEGIGLTRRGPERGFRLEVGRFALAPGELLAVLGPSGSGKSAFLELAGLAAAPERVGTARMGLSLGDGPVDLWAMWQGRARRALAALRARAFGFVLQQGGLHPFLTVRGNVALAQRMAGRPDPARVDALLDRLGLADRAGARPAHLSVGQRQRAAVARALAHRPAIVIADEPTSALDPDNAAEVLALLAELAAKDGAAVLMATHDRDMVAARGMAAVEIAGHAEPGMFVGRLDRCSP